MEKQTIFGRHNVQATQQSRQSIHLVVEVLDDGESLFCYQIQYVGRVKHSEDTKFSQSYMYWMRREMLKLNAS